MRKNETKTKKTKVDKLTAIAVSVIAIVLACVLAVTAVLNLGIGLRVQTVAKGEETRVDGAMMSFFVNDAIMNWYMSYYSYAQYFSVDLTQDLRSQTYGDPDKEYNYETMFLGEFEGSWYDYFLEQAKTTVEQYVIYADAAKAAGVELDDEDKEYIDSLMESVDSTLESYGVSYGEWYGKGVTKSDVRKCYELQTLASKYATQLYEEYEEAVDEPTALDYANKNKASFYTADCLKYTISVDSKNTSDKTDEEVNNEFTTKKAEAKAAADAIAKATTPEQFVDLVQAYKDKVAAEESSKKETESSTGTESESESESETLDYEKEFGKYKTTVSYKDETGDELNDFLFGNEETGDNAVVAAEENDVKIIEETGTATDSTTKKTYNTYKITVYIVTEAMHLDKALTHNFAYLVVNDKAVAEAFKAKFEASQNKSGEAFSDLADQYYTEIHSDENHEHSDNEMFAFDYVEKGESGWFATNGSSSYAVIDTWIEDAARKDGELSIVMPVSITSSSTTGTSTTTTQYAVIYFEKHNDATWFVNASAGKASEDINSWFEAKKESNPVEINIPLDMIYTAKPFLKTYGEQ